MDAAWCAGMRVAVLAGGASSERGVSLRSGDHAASALRQAGFGQVDVLDPAQTDFLEKMSLGTYDAAFLALHGAGGEDGVIQGVLEYLGVPYTGSGVEASACASDKQLAKLIYREHGIPVPCGVAIERGERVDINQTADVVGDHSFVKPAVNGSSYGVTYVKDPTELPDAIDHAFAYGDKVLVEQRIEGKEVTVGVIEGEDGSIRALPVVEVCVQNEGAEYYDSEVKYIDPSRIHRIPAEIPPEQYERVQQLACRAHRALGCADLSRSDFIIAADGPVILETNTIPGMTESSLLPDEIRHTDDLTFSDVCASLVLRAINRAKKN